MHVHGVLRKESNLAAAYLDEEKERLASDPQHSLQYRKYLQSKLNQVHQLTQLGTAAQAGARDGMTLSMKAALGDKNKDIADFLTPAFPVGCRRLTPGPGYLEAFQRENVGRLICLQATKARCWLIFFPGTTLYQVQMVRKGVKEATGSGLEDDDGQTREYDVISE